MYIYFSEVFKRLRKEKDLTQEQMADILCVSPQAVSRWECGTTYPDISILPVVAEFFGITVDELLGTGKAKIQEKVDSYVVAFKEAINKGHINDCIDIMRAAVREFPNNYYLLNLLMYALFVSGDDTGNISEWKENIEKYDAEIIEIGERILKHCNDDAIRLDAKSRLAFHYCETNRKSRGREIIDTLPTENSCKESVLYWATSGEERKAYLRERIEKGLDSVIWAMNAYTCDNDVDFTVKIEWLKKQKEIIDVIHENGDYGDWNFEFAKLYSELAKLYIKSHDFDSTLDCLEKSAVFAVTFIKMPQIYSYKSSLLEGLSTNKKDWETADERNICRIIHEDILLNELFNPVRNDIRFQRAESILKENI